MKKIFSMMALFIVSIMFLGGETVKAESSDLILDLSYHTKVELDLNDSSDPLVSVLASLVDTNKTTSFWTFEDATLSQGYAGQEIIVTYDSSTNKAVIQLNINEPEDGAVTKNVTCNGNTITLKYGYVVQEISEIIINNANFNLTDGLVPKIKTEEGTIFTAEPAESDKYYVYYESWINTSISKFFTSTEFFNNDAHTNGGEDLFDKFEDGNTYKYTIWVKPVIGYKFTEDVKIVLNGLEYTYDSARDVMNDDAGVWFSGIKSVTIGSNKDEGKNSVSKTAFSYLGEDAEKADFKLTESSIITVNSKENVLKEVVMAGYDNTPGSFLVDGSMFLVIDVDTVGYDKDTLSVVVKLPVPANYNSSLVKLISADGTKEFNPIEVSQGEATFEIVLNKTTRQEGRYDTDLTIVFQKGSVLTTSSSDNVANVVVIIKDVDADALDIKKIEISDTLQSKEKNLKKVYDITALKDGSVVKVSDTEVQIEIPLDDDLKGFEKYEVVYIDNGKVIERIPASIEDGKLTFITSHLSEYGIVAYNGNQNSNENNPQTLDNISQYINLGSISLIGLLSSGLYLRKKMN